MAEGFPRQIKMKIDEDRYWEGLGRQEMDFHQVLGELIDNSVSASGFDADGDLIPFTIEITIQHIGNKVKVKVADQGMGMTLEDLERHVLSPGGKGSSEGPLNEHGFGLKNALCMLSLGNKLPFRIQTWDQKAVKENRYYFVEGPFSSGMLIQLDDSSKWNTNLSHAVAARGTRVYAETSYEYFKTLYRRGKYFEEPLIIRLIEHLGVMYRGFLVHQSNKIWLRWQDLGNDEQNPNNSAPWREERIKPILVPYDSEGCSEKPIPINCSEGKAVAKYKYGMLDKGTVKDATKGWPYPLMIYYQANTTTQGIDVSVKNRVVKTGQLPEIWPDITRDNHYNYFVGELLLDKQFRTVNNKIALDSHSPFWQRLLEKLSAEPRYSPTEHTREETEKSLKEKLKKILEGAVSGSKAHIDRPVWSGSGVKIDIYHQKPKGNDVYEVKRGTAGPLDVYQLLMYWDGVVVDEKKSPDLARLVAKEAPSSVTNIIDKLNERKDTLDKPYKFEFRRIDEFGI